jgi:ABC-type antimicrobial peptide transport system permease subunit
LQGRQTYVVDEHFEQFYFPGRSAVGCHFDFDGPQAKDSDWPVIVGVVRNVPQNGIEDRSNIPFVYYPVLETHPDGFCIFLRSIRPISDVILTLREKLRSIDPAIQLFDAETLQEDIDQSFYNRRTVMLLLGGFALLALFLSAIGIYGVLAYDVSQRTREIGIRGAIGASRPQLVGLIMRQGLQKTGIGLVLGLALAMVLSRYMATLLFELKPSDPWTYIMVSTLLAVIAGIASYLPALRALKIAPVEALRAE